MFAEPPPPLAYPLHTARLTLRPFTPADVDDVFDYYSRPEVVRYLYSRVKDRAACAAWVAERQALTDMHGEGQRIVLAVALTGQSKVIADLTLKWISEAYSLGEVGYAFNSDYHGQGYATEAAAALLDLGFGHYGFHRMSAHCDACNTASYRLMERLGMRREAHFIQNEFVKGEWTDELVYSLLRTEWEALRRRT